MKIGVNGVLETDVVVRYPMMSDQTGFSSSQKKLCSSRVMVVVVFSSWFMLLQMWLPT
jgi:hypothetical protein